MGNVAPSDDAMEQSQGKFFTTLGGRFFRTLGEGRTLMPWGISDVVDRRIDPTSPEDLTFAEIECRRRVMEVVDRLRAEEPAFAHAYLSDIAWQLGIYESRRLRGQYVLSADDAGASFDDSIALTGHSVQYGTTYEIPYRCLLPQALDGLLVAGRCISADTRVHQATKEIPPCFATGEAAGHAAAMAVACGVSPAQVDVGTLQQRLIESGAIVRRPN